MTNNNLKTGGEYKYYLYIAILFVAVLLISGTTATKIIQLGPLALTGSIFLFPISYIFGDILTEVYGYKASRKIIWSGFGCLLLMSFSYWFVQILPAASFWKNQEAYELILGTVPRISIASIIAYFAGEFSNSFVLSKMKILTKGKYLWTRTIGSTVVGELVDSIIFFTIAFAGTVSVRSLFLLIISAYIAKTLYEVVITPITYIIVNKLKKAEGVDVYDYGVDYNPFTLK